jgi:ring-1,2-phenylacetyl-CoA epoxidase subunit PaaD
MHPAQIEEQSLWRALQEIPDPEIPVLSIVDLGILRDVHIRELADGGKEAEVTITATYMGCPAMDMIAAEIRAKLHALGFQKINIIRSVSPAWTTAWMTEAGKEKLREYGIAPPDKRFSIPADGVACPRCGSTHTALLSEFGSTACKALYRCEDCLEPFDYFKCH